MHMWKHRNLKNGYIYIYGSYGYIDVHTWSYVYIIINIYIYLFSTFLWDRIGFSHQSWRPTPNFEGDCNTQTTINRMLQLQTASPVSYQLGDKDPAWLPKKTTGCLTVWCFHDPIHGAFPNSKCEHPTSHVEHLSQAFSVIGNLFLIFSPAPGRMPKFSGVFAPCAITPHVATKAYSNDKEVHERNSTWR